jgi:nicotinamide-nucleotide amidase
MPHKRAEVQLEDFFSRILSAIGSTTDQQIAELLKEKKLTIAAAESLTGGLISSRLTALAGSSGFFIGGVVCYHNRIKVIETHVPAATIVEFGAVSAEVAVAMAEGIQKKYKTSIGISATGSAGPEGVPGGAKKNAEPIGTVYIALATKFETKWKKLSLMGTRAEIRDKAAQAALGLLWAHLTEEETL